MNITLNQEEIETALIEYIANQGVNVGGSNVTIDLVAGRGDNGHRATIDLVMSEQAVPADLQEVVEELPAVVEAQKEAPAAEVAKAESIDDLTATPEHATEVDPPVEDSTEEVVDTSKKQSLFS